MHKGSPGFGFYLLLCWLLIWPCTTLAQQTVPLTLTIAHSADSPPYFFLNSTGQPTGIVVELWRMLGKRGGFDVVFVQASETNALSMVEQGQADAYAGIVLRPDLETHFDFTMPLLDMGVGVFAPEHPKGGMPWLETQRASVGYVQGDPSALFLSETHPGLRLTPYPTAEALAAAAALGKVQAISGPTLAMHTLLNAMGLDDRLQLVDRFPGITLRIAVRHGNDALLDKLNETISALDLSDIRAMEQRWLAPPPRRALWLWLALAGAVAVIGAMAFMVYANRLRSQATSRIREAELLRDSLMGEMGRHHKTQVLLAAAIEQSPLGTIITYTDPAMHSLYNKQALQLLGMSVPLDKNNLPPSLPFSVFTRTGTLVPVEEQPLLMALRHGVITENAEFRLVLDNGTEFWIMGNASPVRTPDGSIAAAVLVFSDITASRNAAHEMARFKFLLDSGAEEVYQVRPDGTIDYVNEAVARSLGYQRAELTDAHINKIDPSYTQQAFSQLLAQVRVGQRTFETTQVNRTGQQMTKEITAFYMRFGDEEFVCAFGRDITSRKRMQQELFNTRALFAAALDQALTGIIMGDSKTGKVTVVNRAAATMLGFAPEDLLGQSVNLHMPEWTFLTEEGEISMPGETPLSKATLKGEIITDMEVRLLLPGRPETWILCSAAPINGPDGTIMGGIVVMADITARKKMETQLLHKAQHDPLTRLPNRSMCLERIQALNQEAASENAIFAVAFIDLDRFKMLNDSLGHSFGDRVLIRVAERLKMSLRTQDMVCRFGGDEFVLIIVAPTSSEDAQSLIRGAVESLRQPLNVEGQDMRLTASVGMVIGPTADSPTAETILQNADVAMHRAKEAGRDRIRMFHPGMLRRAMELMALDADMRRALELQEFLVYFQPVFNSDGLTMRGMEALVRWKSPVRGLVGPNQFIPHAEESGIIVPLGDWVLRRACSVMAAWRAAYPQARNLFLAVNLSGRQFALPDIVENVRQILVETGLPPTVLKIEITESTLMSDPEHALAAMRRLRALGVSLAIDDFGTGYSSLAYLQRFPVDILKIDRAFVRDLPNEGSDSRALVLAIMALAHSLRLSVVAEGVETVEQLELLRGFGCEAMQGFLFSPPVPEIAIPAFFSPALPN